MKKNIILTQRIGFFIALIISGYTTQSAQAEISSTEKSWVTITNGCKLWTYPYDNVTWTWSGKCVDGYADGIGILQQHVSGMSDGDLFRYEGNLVHGIKSGKGAYFAGGQKYRYKVEGEFDNDVINGPCKYTSKSSAQFNGTCKNDQKENGTEITADGIVLTLVNGEIKNSSYQSGNTDSASEHRLGTIFKALAGAVVSVKTGDSTLLNQAVQEANGSSSAAIPHSSSGISVSDSSITSSNTLTKNYEVTKALNYCISVQPYNSRNVKLINNCGQKVDIHWFMGGDDCPTGRGNGCLLYIEAGSYQTQMTANANGKMLFSACPMGYYPYKPNIQSTLEHRSTWAGEGPFICAKNLR